MATQTPTRWNREALELGALELEARDVIALTRELVRGNRLKADATSPTELGQSLARLSEQLQRTLGPTLWRDAARAAGVCEMVAELTELQQDLRDHVIETRFRTLARIHHSLGRLRGLATPAELLAAAPEELCRCCDFDRATVSRVRGSSWVMEGVWVAPGQDARVTRRLVEFIDPAKAQPIPLTPKMLETELARRGVPALVTDPANDPRTFGPLMEASQTRAYVAAPIMPAGRVIGFLHADCYGSGRELTTTERDNLWTFAEGFGMIFERMILLDRLVAQRDRVRQAFRAADCHIAELSESDVRLARHTPDSSLAATTAAGMFAAPDVRIERLLTAREREVIALMVTGARNNQIANQLVISEGTVKSHVRNICKKLHVRNRAQATSKYLNLTMLKAA